MSERDDKQAAEQARAGASAATQGVETPPAAATTANDAAATEADGDAEAAPGEPLYDLSASERDALNKRDRERLEKQQAKVDDARGYYVSEWRGLRRWQCQMCPYDTFDEAVMVRHVEMVHRPAPVAMAAQTRVSPVVDRFGNPIIVTG